MRFVIFTFATKVIDVRTIGPKNSWIGFATINQFIFKFFGIILLNFLVW